MRRLSNAFETGALFLAKRMVTRFPLPLISLLDFHLKTVNLH